MFKKIVILGLLQILFFAVLVFGYIIPGLESTIIEKKKEKAREIVETASSVVHREYTLVARGEKTEEQAKADAISIIKNIRYGDENKDYLWINDFRPYMIMHPYRSDLDGKDISNFQDPNGKKLFVEMVEVCKQYRRGFVTYYWQWKDNKEKIVPKVSFVQSFTPWGWIIGTGIYIEDVRSEILKLNVTVGSVFFAALVLSTIFLFLFAKSLSKPLVDVSENLSAIAKGDLTVRVKNFGNTSEIGKLTASFHEFVSNMSGMMRGYQYLIWLLNDTVNRLTRMSSETSEGSQTQVATFEEISAATEEMSTGQDSIAQLTKKQMDDLNFMIERIKSLSSYIEGIGKGLDKTLGLAKEIVSSIEARQKTIEGMNLSMSNISNSSKKMNGILDMINKISGNINLLALNASIEAARAGDAGRGFAVVAEEVSRLADQTANSVREIDQLIRINESDIERGKTAMQETIQYINSISGLVNSIQAISDELTSTMKLQLQENTDIKSITDRVKKQSEDIKFASAEQRIGILEVVESLVALNDFTQKLSHDSIEINVMSERLKGIAHDLSDKLSYFKIPEEDG